MSRIPVLSYLDEVEELFGFHYPDSYRALCVARGGECIDIDPEWAGYFISDVGTLREINSRVGAEGCGDYEQAILGKRLPKDGMRFWGGIVPIFAADNGVIFGFATFEESERVYAWNVHTIVFDYTDVLAWLSSISRPPASAS